MSRIPDTQRLDTRHVRRAFARAAATYDDAATLQREVESRLLESLDHLALRTDRTAGWTPGLVLDLGSGPAHAARAMRVRWPRARVIAMDIALPMLRLAQPRWNPLRKRIDRINADARALPLADGSVDVLFCSLCLQWVDDLATTFAGFRRVLKPGGLLLCSSFGPDTLHELRAAFASVDDAPHVSPFASIAQFGDALMHAGFRDPVLDRDVFMQEYDDLAGLMRELRALGATNALATRRHTLTGRARFAAAATAYAPLQREGGRLPATWEVIYAQAWGSAPGTPIREGGFDVVSVPAAGIPVRRRQ